MSDANPVDRRGLRQMQNLVPTSRENNLGAAKGRGVTASSSSHHGEPGPSSRSRPSMSPDSASPNSLNKGKVRGKHRAERSTHRRKLIAICNVKIDNGELRKDSLCSQTDVDEVERLLNEETRREARYWEEVDNQKGQMKDVRGRKKKTRQDMLDDRFTEDDRKELAAKYKRLEVVHKLAEEEILAEVRRDLAEQEKESFDMRKTVTELRGQIKTLQEKLDVTEVRLKNYEEKYPELAETDISTPTSSKVSLDALENGPASRGPAIAGLSSMPISQAPDEDAEKRDRQSSPSGTVKDSDTGATLTRSSTRSSGTSSNKRQSWEVVKKSVRKQEYDSAFVAGGKVVREETTTLLKPENAHHKKSSSKDSQKKKSRSSRDQK
ncbi:hypothetical protein N431DRAFT_501984 [Stipitochalara longipes BDJ]|nr:hypothetical protein N431DRAFT_501984 [Stipitochalara longipes BDJ]